LFILAEGLGQFALTGVLADRASKMEGGMTNWRISALFRRELQFARNVRLSHILVSFFLVKLSLTVCFVSTVNEHYSNADQPQ